MTTIVYTIGDRVCEWDDAKAGANAEKHGLTFETAARIFEGRTVTEEDKERDDGELRERTYGKIEGAVIVTVIHTDRTGRTRLISARRASRGERARFEEALRSSVDLGGTGGDV